MLDMLGAQTISFVVVSVELFNCLCHLLLTFASSLDPAQAQHFVKFDLDPNCLIF